MVGSDEGLRELAIATVAVAEARRARPREVAQQDIPFTQPGVGVELVELLHAREVALDHAARQRSVLPPLNVYGNASLVLPRRMQHRAVPEGPEIRRGTRVVVADPDDLLVSGHGGRYPRPVHVIAPQQVICNDRPRGMYHCNDAVEGEVFVALNEEHGRQRARQTRAWVAARDGAGEQ